jgi:thiamine biosynthesis protein ThiI
MVKVASALGRREGAEVLVTGDSLGQVSSQTLHNLGVVEQAADLPLLRPLVAWDKAEIVKEAEEIGTFAVSALPAEDCCTLFASPRAETRAAPEKLRTLEARLDLGQTVDELVAAAECVRPRVEGAYERNSDSGAFRPILHSSYTGNIPA